MSKAANVAIAAIRVLNSGQPVISSRSMVIRKGRPEDRPSLSSFVSSDVLEALK